MRRVAVFGNAGSGKSTLARRLAEITGLPLYPLDLIQFRPGGEPVPHEEYLRQHAELLLREEWIIDGFGDVKSAWERFAAADTLIHVDPPMPVCAWRVTKRFAKGMFVRPEGWPEGSPMWRSTLQSYRVLRLCDRHLTPKYRQLIVEEAGRKRTLGLRSNREMKEFLEAAGREAGNP
jgi:adenylate kinase family enzyme